MLHVSVIKGCECPHLHTLSTGPSPKRLPGAIDRRYPRAAGGWCSELTEETHPPSTSLEKKPTPLTQIQHFSLKLPQILPPLFPPEPYKHRRTGVMRSYTFFTTTVHPAESVPIFLTATSRTVGPRPWFHFSLWLSEYGCVSNWDTLKISLVFEN